MIENGTRVTAIIINMAIKENTEFTRAVNTLDTGKRYFGTYTFLSNGAFQIMEYMASVVASLFRVKIK